MLPPFFWWKFEFIKKKKKKKKRWIQVLILWPRPCTVSLKGKMGRAYIYVQGHTQIHRGALMLSSANVWSQILVIRVLLWASFLGFLRAGQRLSCERMNTYSVPVVASSGGPELQCCLSALNACVQRWYMYLHGDHREYRRTTLYLVPDNPLWHHTTVWAQMKHGNSMMDSTIWVIHTKPVKHPGSKDFNY